MFWGVLKKKYQYLRLSVFKNIFLSETMIPYTYHVEGNTPLCRLELQHVNWQHTPPYLLPRASNIRITPFPVARPTEGESSDFKTYVK